MAEVNGDEATPDRAPLSADQQVRCRFDEGPTRGSLGPRQIVAHGWRIAGSVDSATLRDALRDVVERHEVFRTSIRRAGTDPHQLVHPPTTPELEEYELADQDGRSRDEVAQEFLNRVEAGRCQVDRLPLLHAALGRFDDEDSVLVLYARHTAGGGWSMRAVVRDLARFYAARRGLREPDLPDMVRYREFTARQQGELDREFAAAAREYWRTKLDGASFVPLPTDRTRTDAVGGYSVYRFRIDHGVTSAVRLLAKRMRSSPFVVLFAAFNLMVHQHTGVTDMVLPTITSGRTDPRPFETVGPFANIVPLRTNLAACRTFRNVVTHTQAAYLEALCHEVPFGVVVGQAPHVVAPFADLDLAVHALTVSQSPVGTDGVPIGDLRITALCGRLRSDPGTSDIPDHVLWALDVHPEGDIIGSIRFNSNDVDEATLVDMADGYTALLRFAVAAPDDPIDDLLQ